MNLQANTTLQGGRYTITKVLGQGSFGITYLAKQTNLDKTVAIKEFFMKELNSRGDDGSITGITDGSMAQDYARKFQKEALNLSRLEHSNIVKVVDSFSENNTFYYVMDYIDGDNLNDYIKSHQVSEQEAVSIIEKVADALIYMHEGNNMLHLDLKPGNIMRRKSDGHIFLIDFGLSKHFSNDGQPETSTSIGLGTSGYAPIEQSNQAKNGEFRPTIDVYALGATLYKLLTRETPPPAAELVDEEDIHINKLNQNGVSQHLKDVILHAMTIGAKKRTQSIRAFKDELLASNTTAASNDDETMIFGPKAEAEESTEETIVTGGSAPKVQEEPKPKQPEAPKPLPKEPIVEDKQPKKKSKVWIGIVAAVALVAIILSVTLFSNKSTKDTYPQNNVAPVSYSDFVANQQDLVAKNPETVSDATPISFPQINWNSVSNKDKELLSNDIETAIHFLNALPDDASYLEERPAVLKLLQSNHYNFTADELFNYKKVRSIQVMNYGIFSYNYFRCSFTNKENGIFFKKITGSQRKSGYIYRQNDTKGIFLGGWSVNDAPTTTYGSSNSVAGSIYKISTNKFIMIFPDSSGGFELYELIK